MKAGVNMDFQFTADQQEMKEMVSTFAAQKVKPWIPRMERGEFPRELIQEMGDMGLMGLTAPPVLGGGGKDFISYIIAIHELSKVSATVGLILSVHTSVGTHPILRYGSRAQKEKFVPRLASGKSLAAFSLTEAHAGSDAAAISTSAVRKKDHYIINGSKVFTTNAGEADLYILFAVTDPSLGSRGISAFIVEKNTPGLSVGKDEKKMGLHGSRTAVLTFQDMEVPAGNLLGAPGEGFKVALANLNVGRIGIAAQALGLAEAAAETAIKHLKVQRNTPGQGAAFRLADMTSAVEVSRLLVYRAADLCARGVPCTKEVSMAKLFASRTAVRNASAAVDLAGLHGSSEDYPAARLFRDAKVTEIYEGTSEVQRIVIAKQLLQ